MTIDLASNRRSLLCTACLFALAACAGPGGAVGGERSASPAHHDRVPSSSPPPLTLRERLAQGGPAPASFFPLAVGNEWTYSASGGPAGQSTVHTIHIVGRDGSWFLDDQSGRLRIEADGVRDRDRYLLRAPLIAGSSWTSVDNYVVQKFEIASTGVTLATLAGRFEGCVVVRNDQPLPNGARFVTEWTYAPGVGLIALRTFTRAQGKEETQTQLTLIAYRLVPV